MTPSKIQIEESKTPTHNGPSNGQSGHMHRHTVMGTTAERIFGVGTTSNNVSTTNKGTNSSMNINSQSHLIGHHSNAK